MLYAVRAANPADTIARPEHPGAVPVLLDIDGVALAAKMTAGGTIDTEFEGVPLSLPLPPLGAAILARCDGKADLEAIRLNLPGHPDWLAFKAQFDALYAVLNGLNRMLLRLPAESR